MALRGFAPDPGCAMKLELEITTRHDSLTRTTPAAITPAIGGEVEMLSSLRNCVKRGQLKRGIVRVYVTSPPPVRVPYRRT